MPLQQRIDIQPTIVRFLSQVKWVEVPACASPQSLGWNATDVKDFKDLLEGKSAGKNVPHMVELLPRKLGAWSGKVWMSPDFDDNQEIIELFEGSAIPSDGDD